MNATHARRPGYTLIEVLFALALTVLLLGGLYVAVDAQLRLAQTGRTAVQLATLTRTVFSRLTADIGAATALCDPGRYRRPAQNKKSGGGGGAGGGMGASATGGAAASGGTGANTGAAGASGGTTASGVASGMTGSTSTTQSASPYNTAANGTGTAPTGSSTATNTLPTGVIGDSTTLNLFMSRNPKETWKIPRSTGQDGNTDIGIRQSDGTELVSDTRMVAYWFVDNGNGQGGLARKEFKIPLTDDALNLNLPEGNEQNRFIIVPEALAVQFQYWDGTQYWESWDSTQVGADGVTPMGPPMAIQIQLTLDLTTNGTGNLNDPNTSKTFTHVIAINTASGTATIVNSTSTSGTTNGTNGSGTTNP
jgi:hypothetical protein